MKKTVAFEDFAYARESYLGWCHSCDDFTRDATEGDAIGYRCPKCGERQIVGAETALIAGYIELEYERN